MKKEEVIKFLNKKETYNIVKSYIIRNSQPNLEEEWNNFIAGGSIANTLYNMLYKKSLFPVINDIDFFIFRNRQDITFWGEFDENFINNIDNGLHSDGYGNIWMGPSGEEMRMVSSTRNGNWNTILISITNYNNTNNILNQSDYYKSLLNNFDLNCCCAGLDIINDKIIYTDKFVEFLCNDKIEVLSTLTPLNTAIRMKNKTEDLKTNCDLKSEIELLKHDFLNSTNNHYKQIGNIWYDKYKKNKKFINKHFIIKKLHQHQNHRNIYLNGEKNFYVYWPKKFEIKYFFKLYEMLTNKSLVRYWDIFVRGKDNTKKEKLIQWYLESNPWASLATNTNYIQRSKTFSIKINNKGLTKFGNWFTNVFNPNKEIIYSSIEPQYRDVRKKYSTCTSEPYYNSILSILLYTFNKNENYLNSDFSVSNLKELEILGRSLPSGIFDVTINKNDDIESHIKFLKFIKNKFVKNIKLYHSPREVTNCSFEENFKSLKILYDNKTLKNIENLSVDKRIKFLNKLLENSWIKNRGGRFYLKRKHRLKRNWELDDNFLFNDFFL